MSILININLNEAYDSLLMENSVSLGTKLGECSGVLGSTKETGVQSLIISLCLLVTDKYTLLSLAC